MCNCLTQLHKYITNISITSTLMFAFYLALLLVTPCITAYDCYDSYSCALQSLVAYNNTDINCFGYFSCAQATIISTDATFTDANNISVSIGCHGSFSCYKSDKIEINNNQYQFATTETNFTDRLLTTSYIRCHGLFVSFVFFFLDWNRAILFF